MKRRSFTPLSAAAVAVVAITRTALGACYEEMDPDDMRKMAALFPRGEAWISETGSHFAMYDGSTELFQSAFGFFKSITIGAMVMAFMQPHSPINYRTEF